MGFALGVKFMGNLHEVTIPTDLKGLQGLVGKLIYASPHLSHYKERMKPIEALLSQRGNVRWTEECTAALNDLLQCIYAHIRLVPAGPYGSLVMYPSEHDGMRFIACLQNGAPVAFVSHHLSKMELKFGVLT